MARPRIHPDGVDIKVLPVQLPETLYDELGAYCTEMKGSKAHVVREALKRMLAEEAAVRQRNEGNGT